MKNKTRDSFYRLSPHLTDIGVDEKGLRQYAGRRFVFMDVNVFAKIFDNMEEVAGPVIQRQIKAFGRKAGEEIGNKMDREFEIVTVSETLGLLWASRFDIPGLREIKKKTDDRSQFEKILGYGTYVGWLGKAEVDYEEGERVVVRAENSFESSSYGRTGRKECNFLEGVLEGLIHYFWKMDVEAEEIECACESVDEDVCTFEVRPSES